MNTGSEGLRRKYDTSVFERHELSNGIPVWLQRPPILTSDEGIIVLGLPRVGSRMDPEDAHGTAHFFEHLPFRGTRKKPNSFEIRGPLNACGGDVNAHTGPEWTRFFAHVPANRFELALETVYELSVRPIISEDAVRVERGAVIGEYNLRFTSGNELLHLYFLPALFGSHPLGHPVIGNLKHIESTSPSTLREFHADFYHAENFEIVCGGSFAENPNVLSMIEGFFGELPRQAPVSRIERAQLPFGTSARVVFRDPRFGKDILFLTYLFPPRADANTSAHTFLAEFFGSRMGSPLMAKLRDKRGLVYTCGVGFHTYSDIWLLHVAFPIHAQHFALAEEAWRDALTSLDTDELREYQQGRQERRRTMFADSIDVCIDVVEELASFGRTYSFDEAAAERDDLTVEEVFALRDELLRTTPFTVEGRIE